MTTTTTTSLNRTSKQASKQCPWTSSDFGVDQKDDGRLLSFEQRTRSSTCILLFLCCYFFFFFLFVVLFAAPKRNKPANLTTIGWGRMGWGACTIFYVFYFNYQSTLSRRNQSKATNTHLRTLVCSPILACKSVTSEMKWNEFCFVSLLGPWTWTCTWLVVALSRLALACL